MGMNMTYVAEAAGTTQLFIAGVNAVMEQKGITKLALSKSSGVSIRAIRQLLNNNAATCTLNTADAIAEALGTSTIELLKRGKRTTTL